MEKRELQERTKRLALRVMKLVSSLPQERVADVIEKQLLRSGTSVGANYRAACRARSRADMLSKLGIVEEEADETCYWLELLIAGDIVPENRLQLLLQETNEVVAMTVASRKTLRRSNGPSIRKSTLENRKSK